MKNLAYVSLITEDKIVITCNEGRKKILLKLMGARKEFLSWNRWSLSYFSENELAFTRLCA